MRIPSLPMSLNTAISTGGMEFFHADVYITNGYTPQSCSPNYADAPTATLLSYNPTTCDVVQNRIACVQSLSGTGSLRVGADFIAKFLKGTKVYLSNPTWGNHKNIFTDAGVEWKWYRSENTGPCVIVHHSGANQ